MVVISVLATFLVKDGLSKTAKENIEVDDNATHKKEALKEDSTEEASRSAEARAMMREVIFQLVFIAVVFSISFTARNNQSFHVHSSINNLFVQGSSGFIDQVKRAAQIHLC